MARRIVGLQRVLDVPSLAAVAYGEIASSLYFALGVVALQALGLTAWVLLAVGVLFLQERAELWLQTAGAVAALAVVWMITR
jgi:hypothetical protein